MDAGPYKLHLAIIDERLLLSITAAGEGATSEHVVALTPLKRIMKDYFMICEFVLRGGANRAAGANSGDRRQSPRTP